MLESIKNRMFPAIIALTAFSVSASAAFYSVTGLSKLFAGASTEVLIMAGTLEVAKLVIASLLYQYWSKINKVLRVYLTIATTILILITSVGIYGFLSAAYQQTATEATIIDEKIGLLRLKQERYEEDRNYYIVDKENISKDIAELRKSLSSGTKVQYVDKETGQVITTTSRATRQAFEKQLEIALEDRKEINEKLEEATDSVTSIEMQVLEISSEANSTSELGPLKYISKLTGKSMDEIVNWLLLIIIFVFDPLAISLVIAANFAFSQLTKKKDPIQEVCEEAGIELEELTFTPIIPEKEEMPKIPSEYEMEMQNKRYEKVMEEDEKIEEEKKLKQGTIPGVKGDYAVKKPQKESEGGISGKHQKVSKEEWMKAAKKKSDGKQEDK